MNSEFIHKASRLIAVVGVVLGAGCAIGAEDPVDTTMDSDFTLRVGQTARVSSEDIEITFLSVASDSRCPKGEMCVWAGDAVLQISVRFRGQEFGQYELHTNEREGAAASFGEFHVRLVALSPAAIAEKTIAANEYVALLRVARGYAGKDGVY